jgi:hypothetical protein
MAKTSEPLQESDPTAYQLSSTTQRHAAAHPSNIINPHNDWTFLNWRMLESSLDSSSNLRVGLVETRNVNQAFRAARNRVILRYTSQSRTETSTADVVLSVS